MRLLFNGAKQMQFKPLGISRGYEVSIHHWPGPGSWGCLIPGIAGHDFIREEEI